MYRAFWTWDPISSGGYRAFDEPYMFANNKWFFDKSVWQKMFRAMNGCGFNAMILANTHPFPFLIDMSRYPDAKVVDDATAGSYQEMHHWIFETALDYDIAPYLLFFTIYYPEPMLKARSISDKEITVPTDFALEYTHYCTRALLETYPELAGIIVDNGSDNVNFLQQSIIDAVDAARPDIQLHLRVCGDNPEDYTGTIKRRGGRPVIYSVEYTGNYLVDPEPDPVFGRWIEAAGASNIIAEIRPNNLTPWTSFSSDTIDGILTNLTEIDCVGFSLQPISINEWPHVSDSFFKYQWQRDMIWYSAWGGTNTEQLIRQGQPKWLLRNAKLLDGFEAGSRILELLALYFAGDKHGRWHPQFCSIKANDANYLLSIEDMLHLDEMTEFPDLDWWKSITGDKVVHLKEYLETGTLEDAYGPDEFIEEIADLAELAVNAGEKGMRSASGEKELPGFSRDALCMGRLGDFYVERFRAALSHGRSDDTEAVEHMNRALGLFRELAAVDSSHRGPFRVIQDRSSVEMDWNHILKTLEAEYTDARAGHFERGKKYRIP